MAAARSFCIVAAAQSQRTDTANVKCWSRSSNAARSYGLNMMCHPRREYYNLRRNSRDKEPNENGGAIDLDGCFGLHPDEALETFGKKNLR